MGLRGKGALVALAATLVVVPNAAAATFGQLDHTFASGGVFFDAPPNASRDAGATAVARQADGKIVVAGLDFPGFLAERLLPNGRLDPSFGSGGIVHILAGGPSSSVPTYAESVTLAPGGKIVLGGQGPKSSGSGINEVLVRLKANGHLDPSFGTGGIVRHGPGSAALGVAVLANGKILTAGSNSSGLAQVALFTKRGRLDAGFGHAGVATFGYAPSGVSSGKALVVRHDGEIVMAGSWTATSVTSMVGVALLTRSGSLDTHFATHGAGTFQVGQGPPSTFTPSSFGGAVALTRNGKILIGGVASSSGALSSGLMALRLTASGHVDPSFAGGATIVPGTSTGFPMGMALQHSGRVVLVGSAAGSSAGDAGAIARLKAGGGLDPTFGSNGLVTDQRGTGSFAVTNFQAALVQPDSKIVAAGSASVPGGEAGRVLLERRISDRRAHASIARPAGHLLAGHSVQLRAIITAAGARIVKVRWRFGDGHTARGMHVRHAFHASGHYRVKVTVTDVEGLAATATRTVHIT